MTIIHHPQDDILLEYASGTMAEGWSLAIATHLALCPACRARLALIESAGGALLDAISPEAAVDTSWETIKARLSDASPLEPERAPRSAEAGRPRPVLPEPLRSYVGSDVDAIRWKALPGAWQFPIPIGDDTTMVRLLRISAGQPVPEHTHAGREMTLVLSGAFADGEEIFSRGDMEIADETVTHTPIATPEAECICLAVTDAPLRFKNWMARLAQPFLGI